MKLAPLLLALFLAGCTDTGSHVMIGQARTPIDASQVQVYPAHPYHYTVIAQVTADSGSTWYISDESTKAEAMKQLKAEAAKLGANGLIDVSVPQRSGVSEAAVASGTAVWVQ